MADLCDGAAKAIIAVCTNGARAKASFKSEEAGSRDVAAEADDSEAATDPTGDVTDRLSVPRTCTCSLWSGQATCLPFCLCCDVLAWQRHT